MFSNLYIYSIKQKHWWTLTLSWPDEVQRTFSTARWFKNKVNTTDEFHVFLKDRYVHYYFICDF